MKHHFLSFCRVIFQKKYVRKKYLKKLQKNKDKNKKKWYKEAKCKA
jgi:hypothetical protein